MTSVQGERLKCHNGSLSREKTQGSARVERLSPNGPFHGVQLQRPMRPLRCFAQDGETRARGPLPRSRATKLEGESRCEFDLEIEAHPNVDDTNPNPTLSFSCSTSADVDRRSSVRASSIVPSDANSKALTCYISNGAGRGGGGGGEN
jgi:hypothetical protein